METKIKPSKNVLAQFTGTEHYYAVNFFGRKFLLTDGVKYVAENFGAYWLTEVVFSYQGAAKFKREEFQVWTLYKNQGSNGGYFVKADDGNGNILAKQPLPFTDFPEELMPFKLFFANSVLLLPSEN